MGKLNKELKADVELVKSCYPAKGKQFWSYFAHQIGLTEAEVIPWDSGEIPSQYLDLLEAGLLKLYYTYLKATKKDQKVYAPLSVERGINYQAAQIVEAAEDSGMDHEAIAKLCGVSVTSVSRWKRTGRGKKVTLYPLILEVRFQREVFKRVVTLEEATIEDLARRAYQLGFETKFRYMGKPNIETSISLDDDSTRIAEIAKIMKDYGL